MPPAGLLAPAAPVTFMVAATAGARADFSNDANYDTCHSILPSHACTLRAAINNANRHTGGATIVLPAGIYSLTIPNNPVDSTDLNGDLDIDNSVILTGAGAATTVVDGSGAQDRVFTIDVSKALTVTGITIRGGRSSTSDGASPTTAGSAWRKVS